MNIAELKSKDEILKTYDIYKDCMYKPTPEKFELKVDAYLNDDNIKIFACICDNNVLGVMVLSFDEDNNAEIIGIAVAKDFRKRGIASQMISEVAISYKLNKIFAETDNDAVEFYRKAGFSVTEFSATYDTETVIRYKCEQSFKL